MSELHRRGFLQGGAAALGCAALSASLLSGRARAAVGRKTEARHYKKIDRKRVECELCPRRCRVADAERGWCGVRENSGGTYYTLVHSNPCSVHNDPIEKKPLFHFRPGTQSFSIATAGCNIECHFCQNWQISQFRPEQLQTYDLPPEQVAALAKQQGSRSIALTYTEPVVFFEYSYDVAVAGRAHDIPAVMISNGYIEPKPMEQLCDVLGAVKVDFKAFSEEFYSKQCRGHLAPVLKTLELLAKRKMWFELVHLTIPTLNDDPRETRAMCRWILDHLGPDVPIHFTRFHPQYKIQNLPRTPVKTLARQREMALEAGLHYAYAGNVPGDPGENTSCHKCKTLLIQRMGFQVVKNVLDKGKCPKCQTAIPGVWD